ncbi:efflux RND transporter permease subunit [Treponema sp.]|uniref:efflux RND transporter permease subunit n=1 Tax=Treponema sp. TaxID=166 RepID=UPI00388E4C3E
MISRILKKPLTVVITFTILVGLGIFCGKNLALDMFPETSYPMVMVQTCYGNSDPEEVERNVTRPLESAFSGLSGLKHIVSTSSTGYSQIQLSFSTSTNLDTASNDIRDKIDGVRSTLPDTATSPTTMRLDASLIPLMTLVMKGDHSPAELYEYADEIVSPFFEQIDGVASAEISGGEEKCIRVSVIQDRLEAYGLTMAQVIQALNSQNLSSSAGIIQAGDTNYTIAADGAFSSLEDIRDTVITYLKPSVSTSKESVAVLVRDIADVTETSKDVTSISYLDGVPCVQFKIQKQSGKNSVAAAHALRSALPKILAQLPDDIQIVEISNSTDQIEATVKEVISSVVTGALLAVVVLFLFLRNIKSTIIIGLSIPVSIIITLVFMYFRGTSLNLISLSGLLLGVGMLVDNSIVVLENIYTHSAQGKSPLQASIDGAGEMVMPVISSTLTSVCIFVPMLAFGSILGYMGEAFLDLGFSISIALICSLFTSIILVPVLAAYYLKVNPKAKDELPAEKHISLGEKLNASYERAVRWVLHHKLVSFAALIVLFFISMASLPSRGFILFPANAENQVKVTMTLPKGTPITETEEEIQELERLAKESISGISYTNYTVGGTTAASSNEGSLLITLENADADKAKDILRTFFPQFAGAEFEFEATSIGLNSASSASGGFELEIHCNNLETLSATSEKLVSLIKAECSDIVNEVTSDISNGQPEVKIRLDREAVRTLGLNIQNIATELRAAVSGIEAGTFSVDGNDTDILVTLSSEDKTKVRDLDRLFVTNNSGLKIPLSAVAHYEEVTAPASIERKDQTRMTSVIAVPKNGVPLTTVQKRINALIEENFVQDESLSFETAGDFSDMIEMGKGFVIVIVMAMILVFAVMASQFESLKDPFIIYFTIPLSFIGVALIYFLVGQPLSMMSILGVLMLVGVIVNNGIVLVDAANSLRRKGLSLEEACIEAAKSRLRPIMMSTLTTIISLVPMALFPSEGAAMIQPINLTVLGGLGFGTVMTLSIMPAVYYVFNKGKKGK